MNKAKIFIGSSVEGLDIARHIQSELQYDAMCTIWTQNIFEPGISTLDSLVNAAKKFDFAVLIFTPDDTAINGKKEYSMPRDNVVFELGLFTGIIGNIRTYYLYNIDDKTKIPTDLAGITGITFMKRADGNLQAALGPACHTIRTQIKKLGLRNHSLSAIDLKNKAKEISKTEPNLAIDLLKECIKISPHMAGSYYELYKTYRQIGDYENAINTLDELLKIYPNYYDALGSKGHLFWSLNEFEKALESFNSALEINPNHSKSIYFKGRVLEDLNRIDDAKKCYQNLLDNSIDEKSKIRAQSRLIIIDKKN